MKIDPNPTQAALQQSAAFLSGNADPFAAASAIPFPEPAPMLDLDKLAAALKLDSRSSPAQALAKAPPELQAAMDAGVANTYRAIALQALSGAAKGCVTSLHHLLQGQ